MLTSRGTGFIGSGLALFFGGLVSGYQDLTRVGALLLLLVALVVHLYSAFTLWARAKGARPDRYLAKEAAKKTLKTKMMRWGGVTLLLFIIFHLIHFTIAKVNFNGAYSAQQLEVNGVESPYKLVVASFQLGWVVLIYLIALAALGMHLFHGVWSAAQTFGLTSSAGKRAAYKGLGHLIAAVVVIGFAIPPLAVLFGIAK